MNAEFATNYALHDAHCHLNFMSNGPDLARRARADGLFIFCNTVTPEEFCEARERFAECDNVAVGLGWHPWWVPDDQPADQTLEQTTCQTIGQSFGRADSQAIAATLDRMLKLLAKTDWVGEVGLDFGRRGQHNAANQRAVFDAIIEACAKQGGKTISIHSVKAVDDVLDVLEQHRAQSTCRCIFHWFSGTSQQLTRVIKAGCYFSVGAKLLQTKKGPEYVKVIPPDKLLLETDAPPKANTTYSYEELIGELRTTQQFIEQLTNS